MAYWEQEPKTPRRAKAWRAARWVLAFTTALAWVLGHAQGVR